MKEPILVTTRCANPFDQTIALLEDLIRARGAILFARIDHAAAARAAGLELPPTTLLVFGSPKAGTVMMQAQRTIALDLPLRALVWEDGDAAVWLTYEPPHNFAHRHHFEPEEGLPPLEGMTTMLEALAKAVAQPAASRSLPPPSAAVAREAGAGHLRAQVFADGATFLADEPIDKGGTELGPTPHGLLSAALASCTALTVRSYADRHAWPLESVTVSVEHDREAGQTPPDVFRSNVSLAGTLSTEQTTRLMEIADRCPVHMTLVGGSRIVTRQDS